MACKALSVFVCTVYQQFNLPRNKKKNKKNNIPPISAAALIMQGHEISLPFDTLRLHIQCHVGEMISVNPFPKSGATRCVGCTPMDTSCKALH